jgi:hypothetical protein
VAPDKVAFPRVPENSYGGVKRPPLKFIGVYNPLHLVSYGPQYRASDTSGIVSEPPRVSTAAYGVLVPQVDADGNDVAGVRSIQVAVPTGTYTGWNLGRADRFEDGFCSLQGSFVPFAAMREERAANRDPRLSIEERYPSKEAYVTKVKQATESLVAKRLLLPADAARLVAEAEKDGIRPGP